LRIDPQEPVFPTHRRRDFSMLRHSALATAALLAAAPALADPIRVGIGHQSMCTDTYAAGIVIKEMKLVEKHLPKAGKYKDAKYEIDWKDYTSGPPITNMMLANKLDFGVMGDYPLIVNGASFQKTKSMESLYVAGTGYNLYGSGNAIVVPADSQIYSLADLKGKALSVPVGSAAWGMVYKAFQDANIPIDAIEMKNQSPPVGAANIAAKKIDAHADFCPWSEIMEFRGTGRKIFDGSEIGVPYLHGIVVRKDYAEKYPEIVVAVIKATMEAGEWLRANPFEASEKLEKWTGVEKEVQYLYFSAGGHLTHEPTIKKPWVDALKLGHAVLAKERQIPPLDFDKWITDKYVRLAYKELGRDYEKDLATLHDPKVENLKLPVEVWHSKEGIKPFRSLAEMLKAVAKWQAEGVKVNASYVYDQGIGLKLFGHVAFYVKEKDGSFKAFMRKPDAEASARKSGGEVMTYNQALASAGS
jgi:NitT/TauT family transport system substrate-binding protein